MRILFLSFLFLIGLSGFSQKSPVIEFTSVPDWGTTSLLLRGRVHNTTIPDHAIVVYIFVEEANGWWVKPTASNPYTMINFDSTFSTFIVSGGLDQYATRIIAFLIPIALNPPVLAGGELPALLFEYPYTITCRPHGDRVISWSGFDWVVKRSVTTTMMPIGPGPNIFNDNDTMVWVDGQQRLHLRIAKTSTDWHCSEVICKESMGYNLYEFEVASRVDLLDPNVVAGIFTWDDCSQYEPAPNNYFREIDMEFSKWGNPGNKNSQYVIQPYTIPANINRFTMDPEGLETSTHSFQWLPGSVLFSSHWGDSSYSWNYTNQTYLPTPGSENLRINLWLMNGTAPADGQDAELILNSYITGTRPVNKTVSHLEVFPNPFDDKCTIEFFSVGSRAAEIFIFDMQGRLVRNFFIGSIPTDRGMVLWDGRTAENELISSGIYLVCFRDQNKQEYCKILKK
jgi:hypothetical protein